MEEAEGSPGPAPQALSAEDMVALATALLPSLLRQQTHIPRVDLSSQLSNFLQRAGVIGTGYRSDNVGYPIPDPERRMTIEEEGMEWVAKWVRAARPDLTDACTHGVALALLSLGSRTWFQQGTEGALWVDKAVGDAIVVSEEAVAAFYATPHSNCVVKALHIEGAAFGTPFSNSPSSDSSENSLLLPLAAIAPPCKLSARQGRKVTAMARHHNSGAHSIISNAAVTAREELNNKAGCRRFILASLNWWRMDNKIVQRFCKEQCEPNSCCGWNGFCLLHSGRGREVLRPGNPGPWQILQCCAHSRIKFES